jgi:hypothetical protein
VLFARGQYRQAMDVADVFDSPANQSYVAYLPASLALRVAAADSVGDVGRRATYRARIAALGAAPARRP